MSKKTMTSAEMRAEIKRLTAAAKVAEAAEKEAEIVKVGRSFLMATGCKTLAEIQRDFVLKHKENIAEAVKNEQGN